MKNVKTGFKNSEQRQPMTAHEDIRKKKCKINIWKLLVGMMFPRESYKHSVNIRQCSLADCFDWTLMFGLGCCSCCLSPTIVLQIWHADIFFPHSCLFPLFIVPTLGRPERMTGKKVMPCEQQRS